jgi:type VI protein secretion system component Hcp
MVYKKAQALLQFYCLNFDMNAHTINSIKYMADTRRNFISNVEFGEISLTYLIDLNMNIPLFFHHLSCEPVSDLSPINPRYGYVRYKDDYKIDEIKITIEDNQINNIGYLLFDNCIITAVDNIGMHQGDTDIKTFTIRLKYDNMLFDTKTNLT